MENTKPGHQRVSPTLRLPALPAKLLGASPPLFTASRRGSRGLAPRPHGRSGLSSSLSSIQMLLDHTPLPTPRLLVQGKGREGWPASMEEGYTGGQNDLAGRRDLGSRTGSVTGCYTALPGSSLSPPVGRGQGGASCHILPGR